MTEDGSNKNLCLYPLSVDVLTPKDVEVATVPFEAVMVHIIDPKKSIPDKSKTLLTGKVAEVPKNSYETPTCPEVHCIKK